MSSGDCIATFEFFGAIAGIVGSREGPPWRFSFRIHRDLTLHCSILSPDGMPSPVEVVDGRAAPDFFASESIRQACTAKFELVLRGGESGSDLRWRCAARLSATTGLSGHYCAIEVPANRPAVAGHFVLSLHNQPPNALGLFDGTVVTPPELLVARSRGIQFIKYVFEGEETVVDDGHVTQKPMQLELCATANRLVVGKVNSVDVIGCWEHGHKISLHTADLEPGYMEYTGVVEGTHFSGVWRYTYIDEAEDSDLATDGAFSLSLKSIEPSSSSTCGRAVDGLQ